MKTKAKPLVRHNNQLLLPDENVPLEEIDLSQFEFQSIVNNLRQSELKFPFGAPDRKHYLVDGNKLYKKQP